MIAIEKTSVAHFISGGLCSLVIAMGVGRFAYTPLLPGMQEQFGYIVSGTFLVAFLKQTAGVNSWGEVAWIIVGLSASAAVPLFHLLSRYWGPVKALIFAHGLQAMGIVLPVISRHWLAVNLGAVLFGGTFMGITALSLYIGKTMRPNKSQAVIGLLTAVYGVGQILGPLVSGVLSSHSGNFKSEDWRAFWEDSTRTEMQEMHTLAKRLSAEAYEEIEDHTI